MSEWYDNQKKPSSNFRKLLQERLDETNPRRKLAIDETTKLSPIDLDLSDFFGKTPKTIMRDSTYATNYAAVPATLAFEEQLAWLLQLEAVACKDWLTNKVDRCVTGRVAQQQCVGPHQLPLANCGVMALDFEGVHGMATSVGRYPTPTRKKLPVNSCTTSCGPPSSMIKMTSLYGMCL